MDRQRNFLDGARTYRPGEPIEVELKPGEKIEFSGPDLTPTDEMRLSTQLSVICDLMEDGEWRTFDDILREIQRLGLGGTHSSVSAQLRNLRKKPLCRTIERMHLGNGHNAYRLLPKGAADGPK